MRAQTLLFLLVLPTLTVAMADDSRFRLRIDTSLDNGQLTVMPALSGPAGTAVRYEMVSTKQGTAGKSSTRQSGRVAVDSSGTAMLSTLRLGVAAGDRYEIVVKVYEGRKLVAEQVLHHPK